MNKEELKKMKFNRLKPEELLIYTILDNIEIVPVTGSTNDFYYMKNNIVYFYYDKRNRVLHADFSLSLEGDFKKTVELITKTFKTMYDMDIICNLGYVIVNYSFKKPYKLTIVGNYSYKKS